ncbi:hypothetical protein NHQ30_005151 [Ciborinia camelliae]|nr:hypothetical protein NHQ30_005151 [Ciborinia camelliae]
MVRVESDEPSSTVLAASLQEGLLPVSARRSGPSALGRSLESARSVLGAREAVGNETLHKFKTRGEYPLVTMVTCQDIGVLGLRSRQSTAISGDIMTGRNSGLEFPSNEVFDLITDTKDLDKGQSLRSKPCPNS